MAEFDTLATETLTELQEAEVEAKSSRERVSTAGETLDRTGADFDAAVETMDEAAAALTTHIEEARARQETAVDALRGQIDSLRERATAWQSSLPGRGDEARSEMQDLTARIDAAESHIESEASEVVSELAQLEAATISATQTLEGLFTQARGTVERAASSSREDDRRVRRGHDGFQDFLTQEVLPELGNQVDDFRGHLDALGSRFEDTASDAHAQLKKETEDVMDDVESKHEDLLESLASTSEELAKEGSRSHRSIERSTSSLRSNNDRMTTLLSETSYSLQKVIQHLEAVRDELMSA